MKIGRIARDAVLTAVALAVFLIEMQIPALVPIPGVKLGLSNVVTLFAMFAIGPVDALLILLARILLGGIFSGQAISLLYSLAGGILCYSVTLLMRRVVTQRQIWVCGVLGAVAHNVGQLAVAVAVTRTAALIYYLPVLTVSALLTGLFTGLLAQFLNARLGHFLKKT